MCRQQPRPSVAHLWYYLLTNISANTTPRILRPLSAARAWIQTFGFFPFPPKPSPRRLLRAATGAEPRDVYHIYLTCPAAAEDGQRWRAAMKSSSDEALRTLTWTRQYSQWCPNREGVGWLNGFFWTIQSSRFAWRKKKRKRQQRFYFELRDNYKNIL